MLLQVRQAIRSTAEFGDGRNPLDMCLRKAWARWSTQVHQTASAGNEIVPSVRLKTTPKQVTEQRSEQRPTPPSMNPETTTPLPAESPSARLIGSARASTRDASMWDRPDTRKIKQYHIRWHGGIFAACKAGLILCDESIPSADVPAGLRCRRRGCKESWPNVPAQRPPDTDV